MVTNLALGLPVSFLSVNPAEINLGKFRGRSKGLGSGASCLRFVMGRLTMTDLVGVFYYTQNMDSWLLVFLKALTEVEGSSPISSPIESSIFP